VDTFVEWLVGGGALFLGGVILVLALLGAGAYGWRYLMQRSKLWVHACPECGSYQLQRIHRRWYDRLLNRAGIPIRRYRCPNCHWHGRRLSSN
jgi:predicted RNA-binding Zn-ribbon protein involved in translation (DUF1610 family)